MQRSRLLVTDAAELPPRQATGSLIMTLGRKMELPIDNQRVFVAPQWWRFDKTIMHARMIGDKVLIIFDYMAYPAGEPASNLVAYDRNQKELWIAENPGGGADAYVNFISEDPLKAWNFSCFVCTLDPHSGKLLKTEFTK